jgi:hypothetical protein
MSPQTTSNRYTRSGLASAYSELGDANAALAASPRLSKVAAAQRWREARSWYAKSLTLWIDKKNRGELESDEQNEQQNVLNHIARCDIALDSRNTGTHR